MFVMRPFALRAKVTDRRKRTKDENTTQFNKRFFADLWQLYHNLLYIKPVIVEPRDRRVEEFQQKVANEDE